MSLLSNPDVKGSLDVHVTDLDMVCSSVLISLQCSMLGYSLDSKFKSMLAYHLKFKSSIVVCLRLLHTK